MTTEPDAQFSKPSKLEREIAGLPEAARIAMAARLAEAARIAMVARVAETASNVRNAMASLAINARTLDDYPNILGKLALLRRLRAACKDESIMASPEALAIANVLTELLANSFIGAAADEVFEPLTTQAAKQAISDDKRNAAKSKNSGARKYVRNEWEIRTDKGQSKSSFARQYVNLVKKSFNLNVTADTIARDWLPMAKK